jgi:hypothetical protein
MAHEFGDIFGNAEAALKRWGIQQRTHDEMAEPFLSLAVARRYPDFLKRDVLSRVKLQLKFSELRPALDRRPREADLPQEEAPVLRFFLTFI